MLELDAFAKSPPEPLDVINPLSKEADPHFAKMCEEYEVDMRHIKEVGKIYPTPDELADMKHKEELEVKRRIALGLA